MINNLRGLYHKAQKSVKSPVYILRVCQTAFFFVELIIFLLNLRLIFLNVYEGLGSENHGVSDLEIFYQPNAV